MNNFELLNINYAASIGILFLLVFLHQNARMGSNLKKMFYTLVGLEAFEMIVSSAEFIMSTLTYRTVWRILFSVIDYSVKPILLYIIIILILRNDPSTKLKKILFIPAIINIVIVSTAFFSDICFGYSPDNSFLRGPIGYAPHIVMILYLVLVIVFTTREAIKKKRFELFIIYLMCFAIVISVLIESMTTLRSLGRITIVLCTVFYYMFFQSEEYIHSLEAENMQIEGLQTRNKLDSMTGLLNKDAFHTICTENFQENIEQSLALLFIDLDHFKQVNDILGHMEGDKAIINAARKIEETFRKEDFVCRFGGDEFCICIRGLSYDELCGRLYTVCQNLRKEYRAQNSDKNVIVTSSIGAVYCANAKNMKYDDLISTADKAVYRAKQTGRDKFIIEIMK